VDVRHDAISAVQLAVDAVPACFGSRKKIANIADPVRSRAESKQMMECTLHPCNAA